MKSKKPAKRASRPRASAPAQDHIVTGPNAVIETLRSGRRRVHRLYATESAVHRRPDLEEAAAKANAELHITTRLELDEKFPDARHQGVVAEVSPYTYASLEDAIGRGSSPLLLALDQITDPHNFGAIVRSALAFGVAGIIITKDRCAEVNATTVRTSAGATEHACIVRVTNLARTLAELQKSGYEIVGLAGEGETPIRSLSADRARVLVVGSEGDGLRRLTRERCDVLATIPIDASVSSLNASVAAAVALYALSNS